MWSICGGSCGRFAGIADNADYLSRQWTVSVRLLVIMKVNLQPGDFNGEWNRPSVWCVLSASGHHRVLLYNENEKSTASAQRCFAFTAGGGKIATRATGAANGIPTAETYAAGSIANAGRS
jgi:hypothetical protein